MSEHTSKQREIANAVADSLAAGRGIGRQLCDAIAERDCLKDILQGEQRVTAFYKNKVAELEAINAELLAYAECEEARSQSEDIAETVLKRHGFNQAECTAIEFMDRMRRTALVKAKGE